MGLNRVLEPLDIRGVTLPNRIVFPTFQTNPATPEGILEYADRVIAENKADLVAICRSQVADPLFVKKPLNDQHVNECTGCRSCIYFLGTNSVSYPRNPEL